jgi:hypothetical protein
MLAIHYKPRKQGVSKFVMKRYPETGTAAILDSLEASDSLLAEIHVPTRL